MSKSPNAALNKLIQELKKYPMQRRVVAGYEFVRDIPYGNISSRNALDVLNANMGTCSGKHALLKLIFEELEVEVQSWFAQHDFGKFPIRPWPSELADFQGKNIPDYHDFLKVKIPDSNEWLTVDAVFDKYLTSLGFPALAWDGRTSMRLPIDALEIFPASGEMEEHKKALISALPHEAQHMRKEFLSTMTAWLNAKRNYTRT